MNSKEIIEIISHYLTQSRLNTAILIDGEWGSGKTYFVQNELIRAIYSLKQDNKPFVPVYISLYGVEKTSDIGKEMFNNELNPI